MIFGNWVQGYGFNGGLRYLLSFCYNDIVEWLAIDNNSSDYSFCANRATSVR